MAKDIFDGYRVESFTESVQDIIPKYNWMVLQKLLYLFHTSTMIWMK